MKTQSALGTSILMETTRVNENPSNAFTLQIAVRKLDHGRDHDVDSARANFFCLLLLKKRKANGV